MRGYDSQTEAIFAYVTPESFAPKTHPLRAIRTMADEALKGMDKLFDSMYATSGCPIVRQNSKPVDSLRIFMDLPHKL